MKKLIIILIVLSFVGVCLAASIQDMHKAVIARRNVGGAIADHDCSGDKMFGWSMESTTVASGSPAGCTDGQATTAAAGGAAELSGTFESDGTYSARFPDGADYYQLANWDSDEFDHTGSKIVFDLYITTWVDNASLFTINYDGDNELKIFMNSTGDTADVILKGNNKGQTTVSAVVSPTASGDLTTGEWLRVTYAFEMGVEGVDHYIEVCELTPPDTLGDCYSTEEDDDLVSWAAATDFARLGNVDAVAADFYMDNFQIFNTSGY